MVKEKKIKVGFWGETARKSIKSRPCLPALVEHQNLHKI